jgi:hypothetical protein
MIPKEILIAGKFGELEEAILKYLYDNPDAYIGTQSLVRELRPPQPEATDEQREEDFEAVQYAIETLLSSRLIKGKRVKRSGDKIQHTKLALTPKGEAEAIAQRRRVTKIILDVPRPSHTDRVI